MGLYMHIIDKYMFDQVFVLADLPNRHQRYICAGGQRTDDRHISILVVKELPA